MTNKPNVQRNLQAENMNFLNNMIINDSNISGKFSNFESKEYRSQKLQQAKEKAVKDSIQRVERIQILKKSLKITTAKLSSPNSAGGCDATIYYKNISNKTIKYFDWTGYCINAVGDRVLCEIRRDEIYRGRDTGPVRPGKSSGGTWNCIIYNWSAKKIILTGVEIEYTDGSYLNISQNELKYIR